jgi:hypothetical protein
MAFSYSPSIVTNGLVLYLDAANIRSYTSGSTIWRDLSRGGNNGTLTNGPTFNSSNGGNIVFDGVDDYVTFSTITTNVYTIDFWYKMGGNDSTYGYFASSGTNGLAISEGGLSNGLVYGQFYYYNGSNLFNLANIPSTINWNHISVVINTTSNNFQLFGNGIQLTNTTIISMATSITDIGRYVVANVNFLKGNLASYKIYNRALTSTEILQNFNATKRRFGL